MTKSTSALFNDGDIPVLRFEESDDFQKYSSKTSATSHAESKSISAAHDDPYSELKQKQESLLKLRQDLDRTQRETEELEARRSKEERFSNGRRDISEKISRSISRLERELYNAQKIIEEITLARESYQRHFDILRAIHPETWKRNNLDEELDRSIGAVEDAEDAFNKSSRRLTTVLPDSSTTKSVMDSSLGFSHDFLSCMRMGLAFTLPLAFLLGGLVLLMKYLN